jgi:hypothetical protein
VGRRFWSVKMPPQVSIANGVLGIVVDATVDVVAGAIDVGTSVVWVVLLGGPPTQPLRPMMATATNPTGQICERLTFPF